MTTFPLPQKPLSSTGNKEGFRLIIEIFRIFQGNLVCASSAVDISGECTQSGAGAGVWKPEGKGGF